MRQNLFNTASLSMGMRRMTAFPYEMLKNTSRNASSGIYRAARDGVTFAKNNINKFSGERRNKNNGSDKDEDNPN